MSSFFLVRCVWLLFDSVVVCLRPSCDCDLCYAGNLRSFLFLQCAKIFFIAIFINLNFSTCFISVSYSIYPWIYYNIIISTYNYFMFFIHFVFDSFFLVKFYRSNFLGRFKAWWSNYLELSALNITNLLLLRLESWTFLV